MSIILPLSLLDNHSRQRTMKECSFIPTMNEKQKKRLRYAKKPDPVVIYKLLNDKKYILMPFRYARCLVEYDDLLPYKKKIRNMRIPDTPSRMIWNENMKPRKEQRDALREALEFLNNDKTVLLALHCGFGKTLCASRLAFQTGKYTWENKKRRLRTLIIYHRDVLFDQWVETFEKKVFVGATWQHLSTKDYTLQDVDFYLCSAFIFDKLSKMAGIYHFCPIDMVIIDECDKICTQALSRSLLYIFCKYLILLSATPDREDDMHKMLWRYCPKKNLVYRKFFKPFDVYYIRTRIIPTYDLSKDGSLEWNSVLNSLSIHFSRNMLILSLCMYFQKDVILVMTKRQDQTKTLNRVLQQMGIHADYLTDTKKKHDKTARVIVTTYSKSGFGFDDPRITLLLFSADVLAQIEQYMGRAFRQPFARPRVIELIDDFYVLEQHFRERRKWYTEHCSEGGIWEFHSQFLDFKTSDDSKMKKLLLDKTKEMETIREKKKLAREVQKKKKLEK